MSVNQIRQSITNFFSQYRRNFRYHAPVLTCLAAIILLWFLPTGFE